VPTQTSCHQQMWSATTNTPHMTMTNTPRDSLFPGLVAVGESACSYEAWIIYNFSALLLAYVGGPGAVVVKAEGKVVHPSWVHLTCCLPAMQVGAEHSRSCCVALAMDSRPRWPDVLDGVKLSCRFIFMAWNLTMA